MNTPCTAVAAGLILLATSLPLPADERADWLLNDQPFPAGIRAAPNGRELILENGLIRRGLRLQPNAATVSLDHLVTRESLLRSVRPEAVLELDGKRFEVGGLSGQRVHNFILPAWLDELKANPEAFQFQSFRAGTTRARFDWKKRPEWLSTDAPWPPPGVSVALAFAPPPGAPKVAVEVHYELYDGLPLLAKWITLRNESDQPVRLDSLLVEVLAVVEPESIVDGSTNNFRGTFRSLEAFSDYAFGGNMNAAADAPAIRWKPDPLYESQVHYERQTPCLLEGGPALGPGVAIAPGETFESCRIFELVHDSTDRERRGLAVRKAYRALAPWVQENPILMHVRSARPEAVRQAVDQCAEVGFEMVIMTFGSGFNIENETPEYLDQVRELAEYARSKGIVLGGYSLLASRSVNAENNVVNPRPRFGNSPCLGSAWGQDYFRKLRQFYEVTGCGILEHDGSYPGDTCASTQHPGHEGLADSQWRQWRTIASFYQWCRARGIYLNVPDWYYLAGSSKCGMGYRETNWSLPREQQEIIERQNIFDGTWEKAPSMGWMFVPLTEYHGGGAAATIEPLKDHLEHYETRLANLFGAGVQACYRGPRLYDSDETKAVVSRWVAFYKRHRAILDSDLIHLRRPDGRDWDGWLHVNPKLKERGLAVIYNPLDQAIERTIRLPLYYTGLTEAALVRTPDGQVRQLRLSRDYRAGLEVRIPARERTWLVIEAP